ncbi:hypothetical protein [Maribellus maritimus]|uniref:hypothetical protein n=1 Tax=Maribellus maritimus TaxID=2870838 RepID=UPI001EECBA0D|nr:hypothetical protein [Maribellus maritimus]MCG6190139.1 hypothetical protein [Maribellus maritimus]
MKKFDPDKIKRSIIESYNWPVLEEWTNFHFKELSKNIEEKTGDRISDETLKRVFGKRKVSSENYQPQAFTQHALNKYIDSLAKKEPSKSLKINLPKIYIISFLLILVILLLGLLLTKYSPFQAQAFLFSCENKRDEAPFTATFKYDVSKIKDSVFCSFNHNQETFLPPDKKMVNYFYSEPGIYNVFLYTRAKTLDTISVISWTKEWIAGCFPNNQPELFKPFQNQSFYRLEHFFYSPPEQLKTQVTNWQANYWTSYRCTYPFEKSLDSLTFQTRVQNNATSGSLSCYDIDIVLTAESGVVNLRFTQLKCSRYATFQVSEKKLDGEFNDLSAFSVDMSDWLDVKVTTKNNYIQIFLAGEVIFESDYVYSLGKLLEIKYSFFGSGKIDSIELKDKQNNTFYSNDFNKTVLN